MELKEDENKILKTGLYVKDQINGIGTLTYIDPETKRLTTQSFAVESTARDGAVW